MSLIATGFGHIHCYSTYIPTLTFLRFKIIKNIYVVRTYLYNMTT